MGTGIQKRRRVVVQLCDGNNLFKKKNFTKENLLDGRHHHFHQHNIMVTVSTQSLN